MDGVGIQVCNPLLIVGTLILWMVTIVGTAYFDRAIYREAIERGFAEYNAVTGDWQWKDLPCATAVAETSE